MSLDQTKLFIQRFADMINKPDFHIADEIFAPHFVAHVPMMPLLNRSSFKDFLQSFFEAFPDFTMQINDSIMTHNRLMLRVTYSGTHQGDFLGIPATGYQITLPTISVFRIENGLSTENWTEMDIFGVLAQISKLTVTDHRLSVN